MVEDPGVGVDAEHDVVVRTSAATPSRVADAPSGPSSRPTTSVSGVVQVHAVLAADDVGGATFHRTGPRRRARAAVVGDGLRDHEGVVDERQPPAALDLAVRQQRRRPPGRAPRPSTAGCPATSSPYCWDGAGGDLRLPVLHGCCRRSTAPATRSSGSAAGGRQLDRGAPRDVARCRGRGRRPRRRRSRPACRRRAARPPPRRTGSRARARGRPARARRSTRRPAARRPGWRPARPPGRPRGGRGRAG